MVEFQFFEGCPNSDCTFKNLMELVDEQVISKKELVITKIKDPEQSEKYHFQGSPTILINGRDICTGTIPKGSSYSCRTYVFDEIRTGIIGKEYIRQKYDEFK